jgi:membrane-bound lytic murein transglycosylase D
MHLSRLMPARSLVTGAWLLTLAACVRNRPETQPIGAATIVASSATVQLASSGPDSIDRHGMLRPDLSAADLDRRTAELFGNALRVDPALPVPTDSIEIGGGGPEPTWDIDVRSYETFDRVRHYVTMFTGSSRDRFAERLSVGTRYEPMIRARLRAAAIPEDMYYLALVESGFNPHAYSRAAAVGMWQFMTSTAKGMGLRVDWWVDERRDPVRSTEAAARFLRGLNEQFGSMYLAAAAYNGGPGRIARGLNRYADDMEGANADEMFFTLADKKALRTETSNYVPQLIAAALVAKDAARYGLMIEQREPFAYDSAWAPGRVPLAAIAEASGAALETIQELNPHFLRGMTPPTARGDSVKIRVPSGTRALFDSVFATLPEDKTVGATTVVAEKGATWASVARTHRIPASALKLYNPRVKAAPSTGRIPAGTALLVPKASVVSAALSVPDPAVERFGGGTRTHVVRAGENLTVIAKRYRTTPASIMRLNRLKRAVIFPGQELLVNGRPAAPGSAARPSSTTKRATTRSR